MKKNHPISEICPDQEMLISAHSVIILPKVWVLDTAIFYSFPTMTGVHWGNLTPIARILLVIRVALQKHK